MKMLVACALMLVLAPAAAAQDAAALRTRAPWNWARTLWADALA